MTRQTKLIALMLMISASYMIISGLAFAQEPTPAQEVWEKAITAKGGRERLYQVSNILKHWSSPARTASGRRYHRTGTALSVLPDKVWSYTDHGPEVFGKIAHMSDYENLTEYFWADGRKNVTAKPLPLGFVRSMKFHQNTTIFYLMESKWLKPKLVDMNSSSVAGDKVFVIQTSVDGRRVDFAISQKTYLPLKITMHDVGSNGKVYIHKMLMDNYVEIDGVKVPLRTKYDDQEWVTSRVRFNEDYDPSIFLRAPDNLGPDSWSTKR
jgi:hypothetical protein